MFQHPGGEEVLLDCAGNVATDQFEDVGHSSDARDIMKDYLIGELNEEDKQGTVDKGPPQWGNTTEEEDPNSWNAWLIPVLIGTMVTLIYKFYFTATASKTA